jgi:hypothetical protein
MASMFYEGGYMMWVILVVDFLLLPLALVALIMAFSRVRSLIIQYLSIVASALPTIIGLIAHRTGLAAMEAAIAQAVEINPAVVAQGRAAAAIPLKFGFISTVILLAISLAALLVKRSKNRKDEELVDYV